MSTIKRMALKSSVVLGVAFLLVLSSAAFTSAGALGSGSPFVSQGQNNGDPMVCAKYESVYCSMSATYWNILGCFGMNLDPACQRTWNRMQGALGGYVASGCAGRPIICTEIIPTGETI